MLHCAGDPIVPVALGRYLAENIPNCERYVEFEGEYHASWRSEVTDQFVDATEEFVTGTITSKRVSSERVLATVLFTDIVDSTARAQDVGDHKWKALLKDLSLGSGLTFAAQGSRQLKGVNEEIDVYSLV